MDANQFIKEAKEHLREAADKFHVFSCNYPQGSSERQCLKECRERFVEWLITVETEGVDLTNSNLIYTHQRRIEELEEFIRGVARNCNLIAKG